MKDFLIHIRQEKLDSQKRRHDFTKLKFLLVVGLFGVGSWKITGSSDNYLLLYLIPFVGYAIDLYVHGENFGIRRIGYFVKEVNVHIPIERQWECFVDKNRDQFTRIGTFVISVLIFNGTLFVLHYKKDNHLKINHPNVHCSWIVINILLIGFFVYITFFGYKNLFKKNPPNKVDDNEQPRDKGKSA